MLASHVGPWAGGVAAVVRCVDPVRDPVRPVLVPGPPYVGVVGCGVVAVWCIQRTGVRRVNCVPCRSLFKCFSDMQCLSSIHLPQSPQNRCPASGGPWWSGRTSGSPSNTTKKLALYVPAQQLSRVRPIPTTVCPLGDQTSGVVRSNRCRQAGWAGRGAPPRAATG